MGVFLLLCDKPFCEFFLETSPAQPLPTGKGSAIPGSRETDHKCERNDSKKPFGVGSFWWFFADPPLLGERKTSCPPLPGGY